MSEDQQYVPRPRLGQGGAITVIVAAIFLLALLVVLAIAGLLYLRSAQSVELQRALEAEQRARAAAEQAREIAEQARLEAEVARQHAGESVTPESKSDP